MEVLIDEFAVNTPATITSWENHELRLDAVDQRPYVFAAWGDGGSRQHSILIPAATTENPVVVAYFNEILLPHDPIKFIPSVRVCSPSEPCGQCEGHCKKDEDCVDKLECFKKGGQGLSVPGCLGIDNSKTDWCTIFDISTPAPTDPPVTPLFPTASPAILSSPVTSAPIVPPVALPGLPTAPLAPVTSAPIVPPTASPGLSTSATRPMPVVVPVTLAPSIDYTDADGKPQQDASVTTAPDTPRPTTAESLPLKETKDPPTLGDSSASMMAWGLAPTVAALLAALFL